MTTDGGGWTLVLNYLHKAGTNPDLNIRTDNLPVIRSTTLGTDESSVSESWGHAATSLLNKFTFTDLRFYGKSSGHSRIMNFKTSLVGCVNWGISHIHVKIYGLIQIFLKPQNLIAGPSATFV